jgi:hypothetical protein
MLDLRARKKIAEQAYTELVCVGHAKKLKPKKTKGKPPNI